MKYNIYIVDSLNHSGKSESTSDHGDHGAVGTSGTGKLRWRGGDGL